MLFKSSYCDIAYVEYIYVYVQAQVYLCRIYGNYFPFSVSFSSQSIITLVLTLFQNISCYSLREKCPYSELFWPAFSRIWIECGEILRISPNSVRMRKNPDQNNSEYRHFLRSDFWMISQMNKTTIFQMAKVQPAGVTQLLLGFQPIIVWCPSRHLHAQS